MKIQNEPLRGPDNLKPVDSKHLREQNAPAPRVVEDSVETSRVAKVAASDPRKIERLRQAVQSGTYLVPAREIASRMIDEHLADPTTHS